MRDMTPPDYLKAMIKNSYSRTKTQYKMRSWPSDITVFDDDRVWWFRNNMICKAVAWQCTDNDQYYFKAEEDLKKWNEEHKSWILKLWDKLK